MKKFGMMLALSATVCGGVFAAEAVLKLSNEGDFPKPANMVEVDGEKVFESIPRVVLSTKNFEVDLEKTYLLKGSFRNPSDEEINIYFGFAPIDSDGKIIYPQNVNCAKGTETELAEDVKAGDTVIKLKDGTGWAKTGKYWFVAFNAKDDLSDLPNRDLSTAVDSVSGNEVTLSKAISKAYPAGTKIRAQFAAGTYLYTAASRRKTSDQWQEFSGKISGKGWRPGTTKASILVYPYPSKDNRQSKLQFKDISVEIVD